MNERDYLDYFNRRDYNKPIRCDKCNVGYLSLMWDDKGKYFKCNHCGWDSGGFYKTQDKYNKI